MRINEIADMRDPDVKEITEILLQDCQPFLNEIDGQIEKHSLYRGMQGVWNEDFGKKEVRQHDRETLNTPQHIHDTMNFYFNERFGHPFRNGVFTTGEKASAGSYGPAYAIFPIGNFEYLWNPKVDDMYNLLILRNFEEIPKLLKKLEPDFKQTNLKEATTKNLEIMIWCEEYYYMSDEIRNKIGRFLQ